MTDADRPAWHRAMGAEGVGRALADIESSPGRTGAGELDRIGDYLIDRRLGGGGAGVVFRAVREGSDRPVAVKLLHLRLGAAPETKRAWRELDVLGELRLPSVPRLLDHGVHEGRLFLVTDLVDGVPIDEHCAAAGLDRSARVELLATAAEAAHQLHEQGVIHRDLKPGNILVDDQGRPALVDLGIATLLNRNVAETLTIDGAPVGSPAFMSPEQARGETVSTRSDVYGLGATAYLLLTGSTPHDMDTTLHEAIRRVAQDPARDPRQLEPRLPRPLAAVLAKAVAHDAQDRYASAAGLAADLRRWLRREPIEAAGLPLSHRIGRAIGRHPILATTVACLAVAALTVAGTVLSVWWVNARPHKVVMDDDRRTATLVARSGRVLGEWGSAQDYGVIWAHLVDRPPETGGGHVVVVGFRRQANPAWSMQLCAFDADDPETLLWSSGTGPPDIDMPEPISKVGSRTVRLLNFSPGDYFPERPGREILAIHQSEEWSPSVVRVYSLAGDVLYEFWHDGRIESRAWMRTPRMIVLCGFNSEGNWDYRGVPAAGFGNTPWPRVVFAVRPRLGEVRREWVRTPGGRGTFEPVWYRCLMPPEHTKALERTMQLKHTTDTIRDGSHVQFEVRATEFARVYFIIDESGREVEGERIINDAYRNDDGFPNADELFLGDLPPLVRSPLAEDGVGSDPP